MKRKVSTLFIFPALFFYLLIRVIPMVQGLYFSFTDWDGLSSTYNFVGMQNFIKLFQDESVINAIKVTVIFVVVVVISVNVLGLILAVILNNAGRLSNLYRAVFFVPVVISQVAVAFIWKNIYSYNGILDFIAGILHLESLQGRWLTDPKIALYSVCLIEIWRILGFHMVIILASLQTIPEELYEAADIDGCGPFGKFKSVTLPLIVPGLSVSIILSTIGALKQFAIVKVLTDGGPLNSTQTISLKVIDEAFNFNQQGYASAIAFFLFAVIMTITLLQNNVLRKKEVEY